MAKKSKDEAPNPNSITNRDILQRLNFLYQASAVLTGTCELEPTLSIARASTHKKSAKNPKKRHPKTPLDLARTHVRSMKSIGQKTTVRMDPTVKRTLCKGCDIPLLPGRTAIVRIKPSGPFGHNISYTCTACSTSRRIPAPPVLDVSIADTGSQQVLAGTGGETHSEVDATMDKVDSAHLDVQGLSTKTPSQKKQKRPPAPRIPPLFERKVGHIVFRGNERIRDGDA